MLASITPAKYPGSRCPSGRATTNVAPACNGQNNSHTDTSNVTGVFCNTTSTPDNPYTDCIHTSRFTIDRCDTATPFGRPVEPDVKITYAALSGRNTPTRPSPSTRDATRTKPRNIHTRTDTTHRSPTSTPTTGQTANTNTTPVDPTISATRSPG